MKSFKEGIFDDKNFTKKGNVWKLGANDLKKQGNGNKSNAAEAW